MDRTSAGWLVVASVGFHASASAVHVPWSRPIGETPIWPVLIAALRHYVENPVNPEELLTAAAKSRVGMEDLAGSVPEEDAVAREIFQFCRPVGCFLVIVEGVTSSNLLAREGDIEVVAKIRVVGRDPGEFPSHALAYRLYLLDWRPRYDGVADIVVLQMNENPFDMVDFQRATDTLRGLSGPHHEMLDKELAPTLEEIRQRYLPFRRVEDIFLVDSYPRQGAAFGAQPVA